MRFYFIIFSLFVHGDDTPKKRRELFLSALWSCLRCVYWFYLMTLTRIQCAHNIHNFLFFKFNYTPFRHCAALQFFCLPIVACNLLMNNLLLLWNCLNFMQIICMRTCSMSWFYFSQWGSLKNCHQISQEFIPIKIFLHDSFKLDTEWLF